MNLPAVDNPHKSFSQNNFLEKFNLKNKNQAVTLFATLFVFIAIPLTVFVTLNSRSTNPKAATVPVRGLVGDQWADTVIGQRDFSEINPNAVVADKTFDPGGVVVDTLTSTTGKAYVWDSNNNRILGIDLATCYSKQGTGTRCPGQIVLGQPALADYGACNHDSSSQSTTRVSASNSSLCGVKDDAVTLEEDRSQSNMALDSSGNLYVADIENNRVLEYNNPFASGNDSIADAVWGQTDFSGNIPNKGLSASSSSLSFDFGYWGSGGVEKHGGVAIDQQGSLWVADTANNRVLRFPKQNGVISKTADLVLGQSNFTSTNPGSSLFQLRNPAAVTFDSAGKLYVADSGNARILVFQPTSLIPGGNSSIAASGTFGSDFSHAQPYANQSSCASNQGYTGAYVGCDGNPWEVTLDPLGRGIWTSEVIGFTARIRLWGFDGSLQNSFTNTARTGGSLGIDKSGNVLLSAVSPDNEVYRFQLQSSGNYSLVQNFFSPPRGINLVTNNRLTLDPLGGMTVVGDQLVVADGRLLFWNGLNSLTNGKAADGYLRSSSTDNIKGFTDFLSPGFSYLTATADKLWAESFNQILIYQAPLTTSAVPIKTISSVNVLGGGTINFSASGQNITGIAASADSNYVWVSQANSQRVLRIRNPLSSTPLVDIILGQPNLTSTFCNQDPNDPANTNGYATPDPTFVHLNTLCYPGALGIDRLGNLYVSDSWHEISGNQRLLLFSQSTFPSAPQTLLGAPNATKEFPRSQSFGTWQPAFDSTNRMVIGYNPYSKGTNRVDYFNNPTNSSTLPSGQLNDFDAWPIAAAFDSNDNLYVYESNRGQVRIYNKPFIVSSDLIQPTVAITAPVNLSTVSGSNVSISANASDNVGVTKVEFYIDGVLNSTKTVFPYTTNFDSTILSNGNHTLVVKAYDAVGNSGMDTSIITIANNQKKIGDINGDNQVNSADLAIVLSTWGSTTDLRADLNNDGTVNSVDLALLLSKWGS